MGSRAIHPERTASRRPFPAWSIAVPDSFAEAFVHDGCYWHAYDADRSISLTSMVVTDNDLPVLAEAIVRDMPPAKGVRMHALPPDLLGWGVESDAIQPARASRMLTGILVTDGRVLIITITSDDVDWARMTWLTIRTHPASDYSARIRSN